MRDTHTHTYKFAPIKFLDKILSNVIIFFAEAFEKFYIPKFTSVYTNTLYSSTLIDKHF